MGAPIKPSRIIFGILIKILILILVIIELLLEVYVIQYLSIEIVLKIITIILLIPLIIFEFRWYSSPPRLSNNSMRRDVSGMPGMLVEILAKVLILILVFITLLIEVYFVELTFEVLILKITIIILVLIIIIWEAWWLKKFKLPRPPAGLPRSCAELYGPPNYEPGKWNDGGQIQSNNNCYNYACNIRTDTFAQPGRASGYTPTATDCNEESKGARADGLTDIDCNHRCSEDCHKVALVIWPGHDFHWYRQDSNGMWSHKPGQTAARNTDNSNNLINDPRTADRGPYTVFCGCFCVCKCRVKIR